MKIALASKRKKRSVSGAERSQKASGDKTPLADFVMVSWTSASSGSLGNQNFTACHVAVTPEGVSIAKPYEEDVADWCLDEGHTQWTGFTDARQRAKVFYWGKKSLINLLMIYQALFVCLLYKGNDFKQSFIVVYIINCVRYGTISSPLGCTFIICLTKLLLMMVLELLAYCHIVVGWM